MAWSKKPNDPISDRAKALSDQIAALEAQIKRLDSKLADAKPGPRLRSTAMPHGATAPAHTTPAPLPTPRPTEPIFEEVDQKRLKDRGEPASTPDHYNDLGVRKYDLAALIARVKNQFRGPPTANPKLVNYLAAGSIQGLRPMRYEKRVARNRFLALFIILFLALVGILAMVAHYRF
jgi:cell division protein FtsB